MKLLFTIWILFFITFFIKSAWAQTVTYDSIPSIYQLYPRNEFDGDSAIVTIKGLVDNIVMYDSLTVDIKRNNAFWKRLKQTLDYSTDGSANFNLKPKIYADKIEFRFEVSFWKNGRKTTDSIADSVVCGDVFLINGQSNAVGLDFDSLATYKVEWVRSFGNAFGSKEKPSTTIVEPDTMWGIAEGEFAHTTFSVGVWGLKLGELLVEELGIPICIINGALSGTDIEMHLRNNRNPADLETIYGRLLYRVQKAGLAEYVKAMIWWQGETDANTFNPRRKYFPNFRTLTSSWKSDYPNIQKIFTTQIHPGWSDLADRFREIQRIIPDLIPDIEIMTCHNIGSYRKNGHFGYKGYSNFADRIFNQVMKEIYSDSSNSEIKPPDISQIYFADSSKREVVLEFEDVETMIWNNDTTIRSTRYLLKDHIYFHNLDGTIDTAIVDTAFVFGNKVKLSLDISSNAVEISYLPAEKYNGSSIEYDGPWLTNSRNVAALSFYRVLIDPGYRNFTPPPTVLNAVAVSSKRIDLTWIESIDPQFGISFYKIYQNNNFIGQSNLASFSDSSLSPGTTYVYEVSAVNGVGIESLRCTPDTATTLITGISGANEGAF